MLELREGGTFVLSRELLELLGRPAPPVLVYDDAAGDRERPSTEVLAVAQVRIRPQRTEERLLEGILRPPGAESADEEREDLLAMLLVEVFERRHAHLAIF